MSTQHLHKTPPESFTHPPLTPPPTDEKSGLSVLPILEEIKSRKAGNAPISCWSEYILEPEGYKDLLQRLQSDGDKSLWGFVKHKLRYDYFPSTSRFILRMPTPIHESVIKGVIEELQHQLRFISRGDGQSAEFAKEVESDGSATIEFEDPQFGSHDPDGQFRHSEANYPGVVLEIAYSQKAKDLPYLADEYILGSDGDIRVVIGINLEYKETNRATLSVWEPRIVPNDVGEDELVAMQVVVDQSFRDEEGNPNKCTDIDLQLQHFATEAFVQTHGTLQDPIFISAQTLCEIHDRAVKRAIVRQKKTGWSRPSKPWVRKRPRESTPDEKLEERHEKRFREDEERVEEKMEADDSSNTAGSSFGTE